MATTDTAPTATISSEAAAAIGSAVAEGIAKTQRRKLTFGEFQAKKAAAQGAKHKLTRKCFQNGFMLTPHRLKNEQIDLLNKIDRSGRYINRLVEVAVRQEGTEETVHISWHCKTKDQRFEAQQHFRDFTDLLKQIVEANRETDREAYEAAHPPRKFLQKGAEKA